MESLGFIPPLFGGGPTPGSNGEALAVSADGSVIVGESRREAFIYADEYGGMIRLSTLLMSLGLSDVEDWILQTATGISDDGTVIVGNGFNRTSGRQEAWIAVIPEPSTALLLGVGLSLLAGSAGRPTTRD